jgi:SAM-dependent MidA family methyltransferase
MNTHYTPTGIWAVPTTGPQISSFIGLSRALGLTWFAAGGYCINPFPRKITQLRQLHSKAGVILRMKSGHPELVVAITDEIAASGPVTFARFMELALYHPQFGYYTSSSAAGERIGLSGDYYTSPDLHPVLGQALARQIAQVDALLGHPNPFTIIEMGPGKGVLALDVLRALRTAPERLSERLTYHLIERSPALQAAQRQVLTASADAVGAKVSWLETPHALDPDSVVGVLLSNELVDAFPVHRIRVEDGAAKEIYIQQDEGGFREVLGPLSTSELSAYLARLADCGIVLADGHTAEINLLAIRWMKDVARMLGRGVAITIDYGHTAADLYGPDRSRGTLLCYRQQMASENPYEWVGLQDMTAHVDFTTLATVGEEAGLHLTGFTNQMSFLMGLGVEQTLEGLEPGSAEFQSIVQLLRPEGMGRTFKVLVQHKGLPQPELDGLRYRPFFGAALVAGTEGSSHS